MKPIHLLFLAFFTICFVSCSNDDEEAPQDTTSGNYFPLTANSYWTYNNVDDLGGPSRDSLYIAGAEMINGMQYTNLDASQPANGFMVNFLSQSSLRRTDTQLISTGNLSFSLEGLPAIIIPVDQLILYDINTYGELSRVEGSLIQDYDGLPITITYALRTEHNTDVVGDGGNSTSPVTELILNLTLTTQITVGNVTIPVTILASQDVLISDNTFSENIGLTYSGVSVNYQLEDLGSFGITLPFPESGSNNSSQSLDSHIIGN